MANTLVVTKNVIVHNSIVYIAAAAVNKKPLCDIIGALSLQLQQFFVHPSAVRKTTVVGNAWDVRVVEGMLLYAVATTYSEILRVYRYIKHKTTFFLNLPVN